MAQVAHISLISEFYHFSADVTVHEVQATKMNKSSSQVADDSKDEAFGQTVGIVYKKVRKRARLHVSPANHSDERERKRDVRGKFQMWLELRNDTIKCICSYTYTHIQYTVSVYTRLRFTSGNVGLKSCEWFFSN